MGLKDRRNDDRPRSQRPGQDVAHWRRQLLAEINLDDLALLTTAQRRARLEKVVGHIIGREGPVLSTNERIDVIQRVVDEALGLGVLEPLLADPTITEIMVNGPENIYVERAGRIQRISATFVTEDQLYQTIDRIVSRVNRRVDESTPMVDARLPTGERVNVIIPPLSLVGPVLTIRRFPRSYQLEELAELGAFDENTTLLLAALVRARFNIVISGGTGTGKTTLLNALSAFIPPRERIVTIEDSAELRLMQEHVISLESRPPNIEGAGEVTIRHLVRNALRMRPDRIIVGEVRGAETLDMLQAMNTGHEGSMVTVHSNSPEDAVSRLETLASMSEIKIAFEAIRDQINNAVDVIIQLERVGDGSRRVREVAVVVSRRRQEFRLSPVVTFDRKTAEGWRCHPLPADAADRLVRAGEPVPDVFGAEREEGTTL
jgi:pilus assembly protein CpaF